MNALCSSLVRPDGNHMWFAPKQNTFLPLGFIKRWVMFLQAISMESNEAPRKTFPAGQFLFFFWAEAQGFPFIMKLKRALDSWWHAGIEAQRPGQDISKRKDCSGRYIKERALEGSSRGHINFCTLFLVWICLCLTFRSWFLSCLCMLERKVCHDFA